MATPVDHGARLRLTAGTLKTLAMVALACAGAIRPITVTGQPGIAARDAGAADAEATRLYARGVELEARKDWSGAAAAFEAALAKAPDMARACDRLGFVRGRSGEPPRRSRAFARRRRAAATVRRALPSRRDAAGGRAISKARARPCARPSRCGRHAEARYYLGITLERARRRAAADRRAARAVRLNACACPRTAAARRRAADVGRSRRRRSASLREAVALDARSSTRATASAWRCCRRAAATTRSRRCRAWSRAARLPAGRAPQSRHRADCSRATSRRRRRSTAPLAPRIPPTPKRSTTSAWR